MEFGERTKAKSYGSLTPSRLRNLLGVGFGVSVCLLSGCATVGTGVPDIHDTYLRTEREVLLIPDRAEASVKQNGTEIVVRVRHVCRAKTQDVVSRTTRAQNFNATPGVTYSVAGLGALLGGLGTATIIDPSIMTTSTNGVEDEGGGSDATKRGVGVGLVGVGGILLVTALVDVIRTSGETEETFIAELEPTDLPGTVECAPHRTNYANATVSMTYRGESYELGNTDSSGALTVELDDVIAKDVVPEPKGTIAIIVNDSEVGKTSSAPLFKKREKRAFDSLRQSECLVPTNENGCDSFTEFLSRYPGGVHEKQARGILDIGEPQIRRMAEANAWAQLDAAACSTGTKAQDVEAATEACDLVEKFLKRFRGGAHAKQASEALEMGRSRIARLEEQQKKAEAAKQQRNRILGECRDRCVNRCGYSSQPGTAERRTCESQCATAPCP